MNRYERRSVFTFMALYLGGIIMLFGILSYAYYQKEQRRIISEKHMALKLHDSQCKRLKRFAPKSFTCTLEKPDMTPQYRRLWRELALTSALVFIIATALSYLLARLSLRPMREAYRMMDSFVHAMIHDINTPITAAKLNANAMAREALSEDQMRKQKRLLTSLERLEALQEQLRAAIGSHAITYRDTPFDIADMLREYEAQSELIRVTCKPEQLIINADATMMQRLFDNLIGNALKYNHDANPINVSLESTSIVIKDQGIGIRDTSRIFETYYREKSSMTGLGLGLGIVKSISDHYGLHVSISSTYGEGTRVTLDLNAVLHARYT